MMLSPRSRLRSAVLGLLAMTVAAGLARAQSGPRQGSATATPGSLQTPRPAPPGVGPRSRPGSAWWKDEAFKRELGLSTDQSARIDSIFEATMPQLRQGFDELDRRESKLSRLIETDADEARIVQEIDRVETARSSLNKTRTLMHMHMRQVLTPDQRVRFTALSQRRDKKDQQKQQTSKRPGP